MTSLATTPDGLAARQPIRVQPGAANYFSHPGALDALAARHAGARVLVVTHGGVLDMLWRRVSGQPLSSARACAIPNAGLNRLRWQAGALSIEAWGEIDHLAGLPAQPSTVSLSVRYAAAPVPTPPTP